MNAHVGSYDQTQDWPQKLGIQESIPNLILKQPLHQDPQDPTSSYLLCVVGMTSNGYQSKQVVAALVCSSLPAVTSKPAESYGCRGTRAKQAFLSAKSQAVGQSTVANVSWTQVSVAFTASQPLWELWSHLAHGSNPRSHRPTTHRLRQRLDDVPNVWPAPQNDTLNLGVFIKQSTYIFARIFAPSLCTRAV